jgi:hypothetical protein
MNSNPVVLYLFQNTGPISYWNMPGKRIYCAVSPTDHVLQFLVNAVGLAWTAHCLSRPPFNLG